MPFVKSPANKLNRERHTIGIDRTGAAYSGSSIAFKGAATEPGVLETDAGENLLAGNAGSIGTDGLLYHASPLKNDNRPAHGIIIESAAQGEKARLKIEGINESPILLDTEKAVIVLRKGTINISQEILQTGDNEEDLFQELGRPAGSSRIMINICHPVYLKE